MFGSLKKIFKNSNENKKLDKLLDSVTVLLVDKDADFTKYAKLYLEDKIETVYIASDGTEALEIYNMHKPDIVISEILIPSIDGIELSRIFKSISTNLPIILISDFSDSKILQKIVDIKIEKFISKPINDFSVLLEAIERITLDIKNKTLKEKLECKEILDPLTGIYNRSKMNEIISLEINKYKRFKTRFSLIAVDLNDFQQINSKYGHKVGDSLLIDTAQLLQKGIRSIDTIGRCKNNEFMIILPQTNANGALKLANNTKDRIAKNEFQKSIKTTASLGVVEFKEDDDIFSLTKRLEDALMKSKESGKNRVVFW